MNALNLLTGIYSKLHNYRGVPIRLLSPLRKAIRSIAKAVLPRYLAKQRKRQQFAGKNVIVSLTSSPTRIGLVWQVVESLKNQSIKPEKIILWLSKKQFPAGKDIPAKLKECVDGLFEIRLVNDDIRFHRRYYYVVRNFPNKSFVTCDDDVYYPPMMLEELLQTSRMFPGCIITNHSRQIIYDDDGVLLPFQKWPEVKDSYTSLNLVQDSNCGVLYPPHSLHQLTANIKLFEKIAPDGDELWFNVMARLNRTPIVQSNARFSPVSLDQFASKQLSISDSDVEQKTDMQILQIRAWLDTMKLPDVYSADYRVKYLGGGGRIIVSMTSFPARIKDVWQVIECMKNQSLPPRLILLWLSRSQFPTEESIPEQLRSMQDGIFQIKMVDGDIRSHKKYYYVSKEYQDDLIFLIDDDLYYPTDLLERTYLAHLAHPNSIICNYAREIRFDTSGRHFSYSKWTAIYGCDGVKDIFFGSGGGTLFKPSAMCPDLTNIDLAIELAPLADDVWLNAMARIANLSLYLLPSGLVTLPVWEGPDSLTIINNGQSMNDVQINAVERYYGRIFDRRGCNNLIRPNVPSTN